MIEGVDAADGADPVEVSDDVIQTALEFAIDIAAVGVKLRPPLRVPPGLKPLLKFHKLSATMLSEVRRMVDADADFRYRLGVAATSDLLDEASLVWLQRPEGWVTRLCELAGTSATAGAEPAELRRELRRRRAAEQAAAKARLDVAVAADEIARLTALLADARSQLQHSAATAQATAAESQRWSTEAEHLRSKVSRLTVQASEARTAASAREEALRSGAAAAEQARDRALQTLAYGAQDAAGDQDPTRPDQDPTRPETRLDTRLVTTALRSALAAVTEALAQLDAGAAPTMQQAAQHLIAPRRSLDRRRPIAIPGGIYDDSVAAAEHLIRATGVRVLIDGYNVAKLGWPGDDLAQQRAACLAMVENLAKRTGTAFTVVFDAAHGIGETGGRRVLARVVYSPPGVIADDVICAEVDALPAGIPVVVITNDKAIVAHVRSRGANVVASDQFLAFARR